MSALHCLRAIKQVFTLNCCCHLCCQAHRHNPHVGIIALTSIIAIVIFVIMIVIFIITMLIFIIIIVTRYQRLWSSGPSREILHCTSCYLGRSQRQQDKKYLEEEEGEEEKGEKREEVQNASARAAGRVFPLKVVSLFLTSRTWGAAVDLSKEQRDLWLEGRQSPSSSIPAKLQPPKPAKSSSGRRPHGVQKKQEEEEVDLEGGFEVCQPTMRVQSQTATEEEEHRRRRRNTTTGRRAHITLGRAEGVRPVQAGVDLEDILDELDLVEEDCGTDVEGGRLYLLSGKAVFLELKQPITFTSLFTGSY